MAETGPPPVEPWELTKADFLLLWRELNPDLPEPDFSQPHRLYGRPVEIVPVRLDPGVSVMGYLGRAALPH